MTYTFEAPFIHFFSYRGKWYPEVGIHHFHAYLCPPPGDLPVSCVSCIAGTLFATKPPEKPQV